MEKLRNIKT